MDVRVLYGNCYGGYSLHDSDRVVNGKDYADRVPLLVSLVRNSGAAVFFAVEMHEETHSSFGAAQSGAGYFLNALKVADPDWAWLQGKSGNHCFYKPSLVVGAGSKTKGMPGDRDMTDFRLQDAATSYEWHGVLAHFRANDSGGGKERDKERREQGKFVADYAAPIQRVLITGDFNSSTEQAGYPRAMFKAAGFNGLRERGPVTNGTRSTKSKSTNQKFWIEDVFTRPAQKVSSSALILTGDASDHNGWLVTTVSWPDAPTAAVPPNQRPVQSSLRATYSGLPWEARVRRPDLSVAEPLRFTGATLVENYCGTATLTLSGRTSDLEAAAVVGQGVVLTDDQGATRCSGPLFGLNRTGKNGGRLELTFRSDTVETAGRIVWPTPSGAWSTAGQTSAYHVVSGPAETRLLTYVAQHLGGSARAERRLGVYHTSAIALTAPLDFRLPATQGRGPSAVTSSRFDILGELVAALAETAGLHFGIRQAYDGLVPYLEFFVADAPDLSAWARFGTPEAGGPYMLSDEWGYTAAAPTGTVALGAAGGEGADRLLNSKVDPAGEAEWRRRVETFVDQKGATDATEIAEGLDKALADRAGRTAVSVPLGSVPGLGTTIPIGSVASAVLDGQVVTDRIRQITTVLSSETGQAPTQVAAVLGSPDAGVASPTWRQLNRMLTRLRELERSR